MERTDSGWFRLLDACRGRVGAGMVLTIGYFLGMLLAQLDVSKDRKEVGKKSRTGVRKAK